MAVLTEEELNVLNCYCSNGNYICKNTAEHLGIHTNTVKAIIKRPHVLAEIAKKQEKIKKKFDMDEVDILNRLWDEANNTEKGSNHNARITALVWTGKHLGMWQEKKEKEETNYTYNIVNYATAPLAITEKEVEKPLISFVEEYEPVEGVMVTRYE